MGGSHSILTVIVEETNIKIRLNIDTIRRKKYHLKFSVEFKVNIYIFFSTESPFFLLCQRRWNRLVW